MRKTTLASLLVLCGSTAALAQVSNSPPQIDAGNTTNGSVSDGTWGNTATTNGTQAHGSAQMHQGPGHHGTTSDAGPTSANATTGDTSRPR